MKNIYNLFKYKLNSMSFINKSVNYSQISLLKQSILSPLLNIYNEYLLKTKSDCIGLNKDINTGSSFDHIIPNNNKKYYLLVTKKSLLESSTSTEAKIQSRQGTSTEAKIQSRQGTLPMTNPSVRQGTSNYNILYFFPDDNNSCNEFIIKNTITDFFLEINNTFQDDFLFEGYLYKKDDDNYEYLLTDILLKNKSVIELSYELRYILLNEIIISVTREKLKDLNKHITINVHPIFNALNQNLIKVFCNNFIYKNEITYLENITNFEKIRLIGNTDKKDTEKYIAMGKYTDVYNVYNRNTNNFEGILYIRGIKESVKMKILFKNQKTIVLPCTFNINFKKWQPII